MARCKLIAVGCVMLITGCATQKRVVTPKLDHLPTAKPETSVRAIETPGPVEPLKTEQLTETEAFKVDNITPAKTVTPADLIEAVVKLARSGASRLPADYVWATLRVREQDVETKAAFE